MTTLAAIVLTLLGLGFGVVGARALVRGRVPYPSGPAMGAGWAERRKEPVFYWFNVALYLALAIILTPMALMALVRMWS